MANVAHFPIVIHFCMDYNREVDPDISAGADDSGLGSFVSQDDILITKFALDDFEWFFDPG